MTADTGRGTLVTFDFEGVWGMPYDSPYDLEGTARSILEVLARHEVKAMFFVVGKLVIDSPDLVAMIAEHGHAIGVHGYRHERLDTLTPGALSSLQGDLAIACDRIRELTGASPVGFRAPYLLGPAFVDDGVEAMLAELGFIWTSNREIRFAEEVFRPDRVSSPALRRAAGTAGLLSDRSRVGAALLLALNARHLWRDPSLGSIGERVRWLLDGRTPFDRAHLVEVALAAPLDCDLLGLPGPSEESPADMTSYAVERLIGGADRRGDPYVLTFHDWIIGSANRIEVLDAVVGALAVDSPMIDAPSFRPRSRGIDV